MKSRLLFFAVVLLTSKGLGGSLNALFYRSGLPEAHGPFVGLLLFCAFFWYYLVPRNELTDTPFPKMRPSKVFYLLVGFIAVISFSYKYYLVFTTPIDILRADMLPAIRSEIRSFLSGGNPYEFIPNENGEPIQHGYFPMLWLSYLPFYISGFDIRLLNVLSQTVFIFLSADLFRRRCREFTSVEFKKETLWFVTALLLNLFSKLSVKGPIDLHTGPYWLFASIFFWSVLAKKEYVSVVTAPLLLLSREPAILFLLPYSMVIFSKNRSLFYRHLRFGIPIGLIISGYFIVRNPMQFFFGAFFYANHINQIPIHDMLRFYGFSGVFASLGALHLQKLFQLGGIFFILYKSFRRRTTLTIPESLAMGGATYLFIIIAASQSFPFLFIESTYLVFLLEWGTQKENAGPESRPA